MTIVDTEQRNNVGMVHVRDHQSAADREIANKVRNLFEQARSRRRPLVGRWNKSYKMLRNRFWVADGRPTWMPSPQIPEIWPIVSARVGWMTDQRIRHTVAPSAVPNTQYYSWQTDMARDLAAVMDATWFVNHEEREVSKMLWDAETYGTGFLKTVWDPLAAGGLGDATIRRLNPFVVYPDPNARNLEECNFIIEVKNLPIQTVDRLYPGAKRLLGKPGILDDNPDMPPDQLTGAGVQAPKSVSGAVSPSTTPKWGMPGATNIRVWDDEPVTVMEAWLRDHKVVNGKIVDEWRVVVVVGEHVLMNEPAVNLWRHGTHPYSRYVPADIGEFWGVSMVELLTSPQEAINRMLAALQHNVELTGNPIWKDPKSSGLQRTQITNRPGSRIEVGAGGQEAGWIDPPGMNQGMVELIRHHLGRMEAVSGLSSITRGGTPGGRNSAGVIDSIQEAAFVSIRSQQRELEHTLRDAGNKKAALICENYTTPRTVAIAGPQGEATSLGLQARHFMVPTAEGALPLEYQLWVDAGSGSHTSRKVREERAMTLFGLGAIDALALLESLDWPNARETYERTMKQQAAGIEAPGARQRTRGAP